MIKLDTSDFDEWATKHHDLRLDFCLGDQRPNSNYAQVISYDDNERFPKLFRTSITSKDSLIDDMSTIGDMHSDGWCYAFYNRKLYIFDVRSMISHNDKKMYLPILKMENQTIGAGGIRSLFQLEYGWCLNNHNVDIVQHDQTYIKNMEDFNNCMMNNKKPKSVFKYYDFENLKPLLLSLSNFRTYADLNSLKKVMEPIVKGLNALYGNHFELEYKEVDIDKEVY